MKKIGLVLGLISLILLSTENLAQIDPTISTLNGMEDAQGNTHLLYRIYSFQYPDIYNDIYNFVPGSPTDTLLFYDRSHFCDPNLTTGVSVDCFTFWDQNLTKYILGGFKHDCSVYGSGYISRFDSTYVRINQGKSYDKISISKQNDSLIYSAWPVIKSTDGGFNWVTINDDLNFMSLSPYNDQLIFAISKYYPNRDLFKSENGGENFSIVDSILYGNSVFFIIQMVLLYIGLINKGIYLKF